MAAKLSTNRNPVYVIRPATPDTVVLETVLISWDTDGNFSGEVWLAINGGGASRLGGGTRTGSLTQSVSLGNSYLFMLRRVGTTANLATLTITVVDLEQALIDSSLGSLALEHTINPPQLILGLRAEPSVDMVRVGSPPCVRPSRQLRSRRSMAKPSESWCPSWKAKKRNMLFWSVPTIPCHRIRGCGLS